MGRGDAPGVARGGTRPVPAPGVRRPLAAADRYSGNGAEHDARSLTNHADRVGELTAERRHARDERDQGCCKQPTVWDRDPVMHPCATVPDLVVWIGPWRGSALTCGGSVVSDLAPRLPLRR